jgi:hypothetical protein
VKTRFALVLLAACQKEKPTPRPTPAVAPIAVDAGTVSHALRSKQLFDRPDLMNKEVDVDMYEPMLDDQHSSIANPGELDVEVEDVGANRLEIAWADHKPLAMKDVEIPVHVHATLRQGRLGLRLEATKIEHFPFPPPIKIDKPADIMKDPARFSGVLVTFESDWLVGFEASYVDRGIWMDAMPDVHEVCPPPPLKDNEIYGGRTYRVRVIGIAYTGGRYGHLSGSEGQINAREIAYLDPKRPECK